MSLTSFIGAVAIAGVLTVLGPILDAEPDRRHEAAQADVMLQVDAGEAARLEAEARRKCAEYRGGNGGYVRLQDGGIVCTDKHGRKARRQFAEAQQ